MSDSRRDSSLDDADSFRILLDTYRDRQNGFVFATNPAALEYDGQVSNEGRRQLRRRAAAAAGSRAGPAAASTSTGTAPGEVRTGHVRRRVERRVRDSVPDAALSSRATNQRRGGSTSQRTIRRRKRDGVLVAAAVSVRPDPRVAGRHARRASTCPPSATCKLMPYVLGEARQRGAACQRHDALRRARRGPEVQRSRRA